MHNPYDAVPEALNNTRLSLRDIMSDMLMSKKMEMDLNLARTKAETETALVNANLERDRLANLKDIAQMNESSRHNQAIEQNAADVLELNRSGQEWQQNTAFPQEMQLKRDNLASEDRARRATVKHTNALTAAVNEERSRKNQIVTAGDFAGRFGASHMLPLFGIDATEKRPAWQWEGLGQRVSNFMQQHPAAAILSTGYRLKSELETLGNQYNTPGLNPQAKQNLKVQIGQKLNHLNFINDMVIETNVPDVTKVAEAARRAWSENPQLQTQYTKYDDFLTAFSDDLKKTRNHFKNDLDTMKFGMAVQDIDPNYLGTMQTAQKAIKSGTTKAYAARIEAGIKQRLESGDLTGAYEYATGWAKQLQDQAAARSAKPAARPATRTNLRKIANDFAATRALQNAGL